MRRLRIIIKGILLVVPIYILAMVIVQPLLRGIPYTEIYYSAKDPSLDFYFLRKVPMLAFSIASLINVIFFVAKALYVWIKTEKMMIANYVAQGMIVLLLMLAFLMEESFGFYVVDEGLTVAEMMQDSRFFLIYGSLVVLTLIDLKLELKEK